MALTRANSAHPIGQMVAPAPPVEATSLTVVEEAAPDTKQPASKPRKTVGKRPAKPAKPRAGKSSKAAADVVPERSAATKVDKATLPAIPALEDAPRETRRIRRPGATKKDVTLWMSAAARDEVRAAFRASRGPYRALKAEADPGGAYQLTIAAFTWAAMNYALDHYGKWIESVPNDARNTPQADPVERRQMVVGWSLPWVDRFQQSWEILEEQVAWPEGFTLTKANLSATGILWSLDRVDRWLKDVPNDDRFTVAVVDEAG